MISANAFGHKPCLFFLAIFLRSITIKNLTAQDVDDYVS